MISIEFHSSRYHGSLALVINHRYQLVFDLGRCPSICFPIKQKEDPRTRVRTLMWEGVFNVINRTKQIYDHEIEFFHIREGIDVDFH